MKKIKKNGYIALMAVLIIGAVVLNVAIASTIISILSSKNGLISQDLTAATELANACAEKALMDLKEHPTYSGNETITLGSGTCQVLPIDNLGGDNRQIKVVGNVNNRLRKIKINLTAINPTMTVTSWLEVSDF